MYAKKRAGRLDCFHVATRVGSHCFSMVCVCPASFRSFPPPPVGCLALASLKYRCTVTQVMKKVWTVPPRNGFLGPGKLHGFQVGDSSNHRTSRAMRDEQKGLGAPEWRWGSGRPEFPVCPRRPAWPQVSLDCPLTAGLPCC